MSAKVVQLSKHSQKSPKKRVINVSEEVFTYIAKQSRPLIDTPDSTLRRLFGLAPKIKE